MPTIQDYSQKIIHSDRLLYDDLMCLLDEAKSKEVTVSIGSSKKNSLKKHLRKIAASAGLRLVITSTEHELSVRAWPTFAARIAADIERVTNGLSETTTSGVLELLNSKRYTNILVSKELRHQGWDCRIIRNPRDENGHRHIARTWHRRG